MAIKRYLAMTAAEIERTSPLPPEIAWMACHFSPYATGLSNIPEMLPSGSLLIVNDITPIHGHNGQVIAEQLWQCVEESKCSGVLLDFQRRDVEETALLVKALTQALPCPVGVSEPYAGDLDCPVFLPPCPHHVSLGTYLSPWQGRAIWLEMALDEEVITLTKSGAAITPLSQGEPLEGGHWEKALHCHYHIEVSDDQAKFTIWRTKEDLDALLQEAADKGVTQAIGLYQELHDTVE